MTKTEPTAAQEREAIVAWLNDMVDKDQFPLGLNPAQPPRTVIRNIVAHIERGDHNGEGK